MIRRPMETSLICRLTAVLIPAAILLHLLLAPYTKVEESFNIQAAHDILQHGIPWSGSAQDWKGRFDHFTFPGPVPRTFLGPLCLAYAAKPVILLRTAFLLPIDDQTIVRAILGLWNGFCLLVYRHQLGRLFGISVATWFSLIQASVFHTMYYASRTLPNFFAFGPGRS